MSKILCAALLLVLSALTLAEETTQVIVGGPAPAVGGIEARPLGSLEPCENVAFAERSKCLQQVADGPGTQINATPTVPLTTPTPPQPDPAAQRALERCDTLRGEEKERCAKDAKAATAAEEKLRGPESVGAGATAPPTAR